MRESLRHLAGRAALLSVPLLLLIGAYVASDPFRVLRRYDDYYRGNAVPVDRDVASTALYVRAPRHSFDSFIFGNSRSQAFHTADWKRYLGSRAAPYHFDASFESLFGISSKLSFIAARGDTVRNALILLDSTSLSRPDNVDHALFVKDARVSGQSWWTYQAVFLKAFLANGFFWKYGLYRLTGRIVGAASDVLDSHVFTELPGTNDLLYTSHERGIAALGDEYFRDANRFPPRQPAMAGVPTQPTIGAHQVQLLCDIARTLAQQGTRFVVVVPPTYDQRPLSPHDLRAMRSIFGVERVADFSGPSPLAADVRNFYEQAHFRPSVARAIMDSVYRARNDEPTGRPGVDRRSACRNADRATRD